MVILLGASIKINNERNLLGVYSSPTKHLVIFRILTIEQIQKSLFSKLTPLNTLECIFKDEEISDFDFLDEEKFVTIKGDHFNCYKIQNSAVIAKILASKLPPKINRILHNSNCLTYNSDHPSENSLIDINENDPQTSKAEKISSHLLTKDFLRVYASQSNTLKVFVYTSRFVLVKKTPQTECKEYVYENERIDFGYFWFDIFIYNDEKSVKILVPYYYENSSPRIFEVHTRNFKENTRPFPLQKIIFIRLIDNKLLILNDRFEFAFLPITNKIILTAFQIELLDLKSAFENSKDCSAEDQLTVAKGLYVI